MDRWEQIEKAYHAARDLRGEDRSRFLDEQCGGDAAMRRTLEALLEHDDTPDGLLNGTAAEFVADLESWPRRPAILTGRSIGPYEVLECIGSGGMGDVYRARDATLNREVALKVLPPLLMLDPDRRARFKREAQVLAALDHPNIGAIHGFEEADGVQALVLELVEGPTLADLIASGPIPIAEALPIARQIADALEAAHEQRIVHRDLKPANIKVRADGTVKVLDFGLAKGLERPVSAGGEGAIAVPLTSPAAIGRGVLLGTAAYMSPEQVKGRPADKRSDVWAFGCVLYEMLTGKRPFGGSRIRDGDRHGGSPAARGTGSPRSQSKDEAEDVSDTLTAVLRDTPDWTAWPDTVPLHIRVLVEACLRKDRKQRIADISTARFVMNEQTAALVPPVPLPMRSWQRPWTWVALIATVAALAAFGGWALGSARKQAAAGVTRFSILLGEDQQLQGRASLAISPDGMQLVYSANRRLYLRSMSDLEGRAIAGTEGDVVTSPVFSPDGRSIVFWSGPDRALKRIAITGGHAVTVCQADGPLGITWGADGLVFGQSRRGIMRVSDQGGTPEVLISAKPDEALFAPQVLPDGRGTLLTVASGAFLDTPRVVVQTSSPAGRKTLVDGATDGRYLPSGHLLYAIEGRLFAVAFDLRSLTATSTPVPIIEGVARTALTSTGGMTGMAQWTVSTTGSLAYIPGPASDASFLYHLSLLDRTGQTQRLELQPAAYESPRFSPDGRQIAFAINDGRNVDLWIHDLSGTSAPRRLTFGGRNRFPVWSPDGQRVAFQSDRDGDQAIFSKRADSNGTAARLTTPDVGTAHIPESWAPGGDALSFSVARGSRFSLSILSLPDKRAAPVGDVESDIPAASAFSPDGAWIAYQLGRRSGTELRPTAYVQPFPADGTLHQITNGDAAAPVWSRDGRELFYTVSARQWAVASVRTHPSFSAGNAVRLPTADLQVWRPDWWRQHDVNGDGKRIGMVPFDKSLIPGNTRVIQVVVNWTEELEQRVPVR